MCLQVISMIKSNEKLVFEGFDFELIRGRRWSCARVLSLKILVVVFCLVDTRAHSIYLLYLLIIHLCVLVITKGCLAKWERGLIPPWPQGQGFNPQHVQIPCFIFHFTYFIYLFSHFYFYFDLFFTPLIFNILKIFPTYNPIIFVSRIYQCLISFHLSNYLWTYSVLNPWANEIYFGHDIVWFKVDWTFHTSNLLMDD